MTATPGRTLPLLPAMGEVGLGFEDVRTADSASKKRDL